MGSEGARHSMVPGERPVDDRIQATATPSTVAVGPRRCGSVSETLLACALAVLLASPSLADDAPRITVVADGVCLNAPALLNSERDRAALKAEVKAAEDAKTGAFLVGGVVGLVVGFVAGVLVAPLAKRP